MVALSAYRRLVTVFDPLKLFDSAEQVALYCAIMVPVEWLFALRPMAIFRRRRLADIAYCFFNAILLRVPLALLFGATILVSHAALSETVRHTVGGQSLVLQVLEATLIGDLGIYVAHRLLHSPALWRFHAIHHSAENMDWLVSLRVHPIDLLLLKGFSLSPVLFLGFSPVATGTYLLIYSWMSLLDHANVKFAYGPLRHIVVGPEFHHWHHAHDVAAHDRNFAAQFALWDRLFGTLYLPVRERPTSFGVAEAVPSRFVDQLAYPFRRTKP